MKITCSHPSIISQSPWLRLSRFVTSSTLLQVYQPQKKRNREKLNELNFSPQNHAGLRNPCSHHRKPAPRLFSKQLLTYTQFLTPGKIFNSFAWTGYLLQNQKKTLSSLCGKLHHHNQMIANLWVKMGSKKTSKLLSKRKSGRKRRGGLERERERKGVSSPPLLFPAYAGYLCTCRNVFCFISSTLSIKVFNDGFPESNWCCSGERKSGHSSADFASASWCSL